MADFEQLFGCLTITNHWAMPFMGRLVAGCRFLGWKYGLSKCS